MMRNEKKNSSKVCSGNVLLEPLGFVRKFIDRFRIRVEGKWENLAKMDESSEGLTRFKLWKKFASRDIR